MSLSVFGSVKILPTLFQHKVILVLSTHICNKNVEDVWDTEYTSIWFGMKCVILGSVLKGKHILIFK